MEIKFIKRCENYKKQIIDSLAELEHQQWEYWTKAKWSELRSIKRNLEEAIDIESAIKELQSIYDRWRKNWKPYSELDEKTKDKDREWAEKVIPLVPNKCPVYQCGGFMECKERKKPKDFIESEHYDGDEQTPDLVCSNCGAIYQFQRFKNAKQK